MTVPNGSDGGLELWAPSGVPEVTADADLATLLLDALDRPLADGDVVCVTSKVVSKSEGRVVAGDRESAVADELAADGARVVARRGQTTIVRTRLGLTMAAAGIDASNVESGLLVLLPVDPDRSARRLRARIRDVCGAVVGVVITDTAGRAWREGQTDLAIGVAGLPPLISWAGTTDAYGNRLAVTEPAVADEVAGAAQLVQHKTSGRPFAVVRGLGSLVLPADDDGPGAGQLVRPEGADLFGYGAREAVVLALAGDPADRAPFGAPVTAEELAQAIGRVTPAAEVSVGIGLVSVVCADPVALGILAFAHGWSISQDGQAGSSVCGRSGASADAVVVLRPTHP